MPDYYQIKNSIIHEKFDDETVIVNLETGCYYNLRSSGDVIWALAASGHSKPQILSQVCRSYQGDAAEINAATTSFLDLLVGEALLEPAEDSITQNQPSATEARGAFVAPTLDKYTDMEELLQLDPIHEVDKLGWPSAKPRVG